MFLLKNKKQYQNIGNIAKKVIYGEFFEMKKLKKYTLKCELYTKINSKKIFIIYNG